MKATSLLAITAALSILAGTTASFASGKSKKYQPDVNIVKQKVDVDLNINKDRVNQLAIVKNHAKSVSVIKAKHSDKLKNLTNINNVALNVANTGDITSKGNARTGNITGHSNATSVSAVGAAASVGVTISSISSPAGK